MRSWADCSQICRIRLMWCTAADVLFLPLLAAVVLRHRPATEIIQADNETLIFLKVMGRDCSPYLHCIQSR